MKTEKAFSSNREIHKYVWLLIGVFALIAATYPTAMVRVSQQNKFRGYHVKSLTIEGSSEQMLNK